MCLSGLFLPQGVMTLSVLVTLELAWMLQNGFTIIVYHRLLNRRQEGLSRLRMTLAFLIFFMWPRPWSLGRQWEGASKQRQCSFECISTFMHVCLVCQNEEAELLASFFPQIQHYTIIDPSLQLTARFVPNQFLSSSSDPLAVFLPPSAFPFYHFSHYPIVSLLPPLIPSYLTA